MLEKEIGQKIRKLRTEQGIKLEGMSERTGITTGYLSKIERGLSSLPIATLGKIAAALNVQIADIFEDRFSEDKLSIIRPGERRVIRPMDKNLCYQYEPLTSSLRDKQMEPFIVTLRPHCSEERMFTHQGEEMIILMKGKMDFFYRTEQHVIEEIGTCLYFDASMPHRGQCRGETETQFLSVISTPAFEGTEFAEGS